MNEFELSTLAVLGLLLLGVGGYSYVQIARAQKQLKSKQPQAGRAKSNAAYDDESSYGSGYEDDYASSYEDLYSDARPSERRSTVKQVPAYRAKKPNKPSQPPRRSGDFDLIPVPSPLTRVSKPAEVATEAAEVSTPVHREPVAQPLDDVTVEQVETNKQTSNPPNLQTHTSASVVETAEQDAEFEFIQPAAASASEAQTTSATAAATSAATAKNQPITSMQDLVERASWAVYAPWMRFESWLNTAYPDGVDKIASIDGIIDITIAQPKVTEDIERALFELRLNTQLPIHLLGARAGRLSMEAQLSGQRTREWEPLEVGAPYSALRLSLQLANRSHCANEALLQSWFELAEKLSKRLAGQIDAVPNLTELGNYARFLHGVARRLGQPIVLQLHKKNGLWPAYEIHQQLTACGAVLNQNGVYLVREAHQGNSDAPRAPIYTVLNDINNPRALDFFRDQMAMMHVHTLSFCLEFARVDSALQPVQRMCEDARQVAEALDAQWQNATGDEISLHALQARMDERVHAYTAMLDALGLSAGALMTKRLLSQ